MNKVIHLDTTDQRILRTLQRQGDLSQAALAEAVGTSAASCYRRIKSLEESGVFGPTVRLVNPAAVGKTVDVVCQVRMKAHDFETRNGFELFVEQHQEIIECLSMSGEWDYQLRITVGSIAEYEDFLMRRLLSNPSVATSSSHFALKRIKYTTELKL
jgi:Lrp/AsnC family transcriptional regulator